jgi:hypothetical protein
MGNEVYYRIMAPGGDLLIRSFVPESEAKRDSHLRVQRLELAAEGVALELGFGRGGDFRKRATDLLRTYGMVLE